MKYLQITESMFKILVMLFSLLPITLNAQKVIKPDIQYVTLTDTFLISEIKKYITEEKRTDTLFAKGKGYINISFSYERSGSNSLTPNRIDTVLTYYLMTSFMSADGKENTLGDMYPSFYSIVDNRLVCINAGGKESTYFGFSEKSKKKYGKILEKYIEPEGSLSRTWLVLNRETRIYYLQNTVSGHSLTPVVVKIKR